MTRNTAKNLYIIGWATVYFGVGWILLYIVSIWQGIFAIMQGRILLGIFLILVGPFFGWAYLSVFDDQEIKKENTDKITELENKIKEMELEEKVRELERKHAAEKQKSEPAKPKTQKKEPKKTEDEK